MIGRRAGPPGGAAIVVMVVAMVVTSLGATASSVVSSQQSAAVRSNALPALAAVTMAYSASTGTSCTVKRADPTGHRDSTQVIRNAITACEGSSGPAPYTVRIPAGTYKLDLADCTREDLQLAGPNPVTLAGAGRVTTTLVEWVGLKDPAPYRCGGSVWIKTLLSLRRDGSTVEGLKLDTLTYNAGTGIIVSANRTTVRSMWVTHGGLQVNPPMFSIKYGGMTGADRDHNCTTGASSWCHSGNLIDDLVLYDEMCGDGFSFAFQRSDTINNFKYQGARWALYIDNGVTVNNLTYAPGVEKCDGKQGFWLTSPSANITINNYVTSGGNGKTNANWTAPAQAPGGGGVVGTSQHGNKYQSYDVYVNGYRQTGNFANELLVANVVKNFTLGPGTVQPCDFANNNILRLEPQVSIMSVKVSNCSLSETIISVPAHVTVSLLLYLNDSFTRESPQTYSWADPSKADMQVTLSGGRFDNCGRAPNRLTYRTSDTVDVSFVKAPGAAYPSNWSCNNALA